MGLACIFRKPWKPKRYERDTESPTMEPIMDGSFLLITSMRRRVGKTFPYYLLDGIYPKWNILITKIMEHKECREELFSKAQESVRKCIKRAFDVIIAPFNILSQPGRLWWRHEISNVLKMCIIMYKMIVEQRRGCDILRATGTSCKSVNVRNCFCYITVVGRWSIFIT